MNRKVMSAACGALLALSVNCASAAILNGNFELGDNGDWKLLGAGASVTFVNPDTGEFHGNMTSGASTVNEADMEAALNLTVGSLATALSAAVGSPQLPTNGSAIYQDIALAAGQTVTFRWRFLDGETDPGLEDFMFVSLGSLVSDVGPVILAFANTGLNTTAYASGSITAAVAGTYRLAFGEMNEFDEFANSIGRVDNVATIDPTGPEVPGAPEPGTLALLGLGLLGLGLRRRIRA